MSINPHQPPREAISTTYAARLPVRVTGMLKVDDAIAALKAVGKWLPRRYALALIPALLLLTVIMGLAGLAKLSLPEDHSVRADLSRIVEAGEQAAHLAGQLLAFSKNRQLEAHAEAARQLRHLVTAVDSATALLRSGTDADVKRALEVLDQARP